MLSRRFSGNACTLTGLLAIEYRLVLLRRPSGCLHSRRVSLQSPRALVASLWQRAHYHKQRSIDDLAAIVVGPPSSRAAIVVGLPSSSVRHCCPAAIVVGGCHRCWAAVAPFPRATSERPIYRWTTSLPYSLGLPLNAPFAVLIGLSSLPCPLLCDHFVCLLG